MENENQPATKQDLKAVDERLSQRIESVNERVDILRSEMQHSFRHLEEGMRDMETKLLKAFYHCSTSNDERVSAV
jgi:hypothetical protein